MSEAKNPAMAGLLAVSLIFLGAFLLLRAKPIVESQFRRMPRFAKKYWPPDYWPLSIVSMRIVAAGWILVGLWILGAVIRSR